MPFKVYLCPKCLILRPEMIEELLDTNTKITKCVECKEILNGGKEDYILEIRIPLIVNIPNEIVKVMGNYWLDNNINWMEVYKVQDTFIIKSCIYEYMSEREKSILSL